MPTNLHLTLAFVGDSDAVRLACLHARAATVPMSPLNIRLSRLGGFRRGRVWWLGPNRSLADLRALVSRLASALSPCGFEPERRPFRAHVTLSRGARAEPEGVHMMPIEWVASDFVLMASRQTAEGVCYEVLARYPSDVDAPLSAGLSVG